jgi:DNA-binding transcriptional LysR family regulator
MLFPAVRDALDNLAEAASRLRARETGGTLTVSTLPSFAVKWLLPRMSHFQDRYPDIDLRISAKEHLVDFARDDIDVAIRFGRGEVSNGWRTRRSLRSAARPCWANCAVPATSPTPHCCMRTCCRWDLGELARRGRCRWRRRVARAAVQPYAPDAAGGH